MLVCLKIFAKQTRAILTNVKILASKSASCKNQIFVSHTKFINLLIIKSGRFPARTILRANILLAVDKNGKKKPMTVQEAAKAFNTSATTMQNVWNSFGEKGLEATLLRKKRETPPVEAKVTEEVEAHIIALAWGQCIECR